MWTILFFRIILTASVSCYVILQFNFLSAVFQLFRPLGNEHTFSHFVIMGTVLNDQNVDDKIPKKTRSSFPIRNLRLCLKYRPEILKLILKMQQSIKRKNTILKRLKKQLKLLVIFSTTFIIYFVDTLNTTNRISVTYFVFNFKILFHKCILILSKMYYVKNLNKIRTRPKITSNIW